MKKGQGGETDDRKEERADDGKREVGNVEDEPHSDYEDVCFICRRPESKAGKMFHLPNHICVCDDCMHKTMDTVSQ
ncbi:MAG: ClpX C4-type zinc finger protein, partial [Lachnospiraceae bacterium]|nr:ClpX C4-type zinc finger protein [Lachnospiraceae bacterium]